MARNSPPNSYAILIVGGSGSGKTNALLNLVNHDRNIDNFFYMLKTHVKQFINYYLTKEKVHA